MGHPHKKPITDELKASRYAFLFFALLTIFLSVPFVAEGGTGDIVLEALFVIVLLTSFRAVGHNRVVLSIAIVLGLGMFLAPAWGLFEPTRTTAIISGVALTGMFALVGCGIAVDVYRARSVTFGTILGACSAYVLLGLFWFGVFGLIDLLQPEAFSYTDMARADVARVEAAGEMVSEFLLRRGQLFYFSFVTLTTLGYGDISPVSELARTYATLEAVTGQLFIAILVARLVGLQLTTVMAKEKGDTGA